jgi:hypothetical protein
MAMIGRTLALAVRPRTVKTVRRGSSPFDLSDDTL